MFDENYQDAQDRTLAFNLALDKLLLEHGAELSITEEGDHFISRTSITVTMAGVYSTPDNPFDTKAFTEFDLEL